MKAENSWFDKSTFRTYLIFLLSFLLIYLDFSNQKIIKELKKYINDATTYSTYIITYPIKKLIEIPREIKIIIDLKDQKNQLVLLENKIEELQQQNYFLKQDYKKNQEFLKEEEPYRSEVIYAKVISNIHSIFSNSFMLNKGSQDGLKIGNPVIKNNNLIGQISEVNYNSARGIFLTDINSRVPVVIGESMHNAILVGSPLKQNKLSLEFLPKDYKIQNNDKIFTSDIDGILKKGIAVGYIEVKEGSNNYIIHLNYEILQIDRVSIFIN